MTATVAPTNRRRGLRGTLSDIYHERTNFDFIGRSRIWFLVSGAAVLISLFALVYSGLNLGIDFDGGTQWEFRRTSGTVAAEDVRRVLADTPGTDAKVLVLGDDGARVQTEELKPAQQAAITAALAKYAGVSESTVSIVTVGPTWGDQVSRKAITALIFFFILIAAYLTFRFQWKMALAAIIAVLHDIIITVGVYAIFGFEVTPGTVVAFLTILGFSLYDTVVVFDKIDENTPSLGTERGDTYSLMVNRSMNQVLMRSLNTTFVALLPVASLLVVGSGILGAATLRDFALALFVGLLVGAYSSIFVATPILARFKEREPRNVALRERSAVQLARGVASGASGAPAPEAESPGMPEPGPSSPQPSSGQPSSSDQAMRDQPVSEASPGTAARPEASSPSPPGSDGVVAPRPRQQRRRKRR
ncbi:MAG: protein translocase subunit SecF [Acidimicrobiia bacterium]|nr:protein translocase subunit SecF [Acidimicrobiia bacterium]